MKWGHTCNTGHNINKYWAHASGEITLRSKLEMGRFLDLLVKMEGNWEEAKLAFEQGDKGKIEREGGI